MDESLGTRDGERNPGARGAGIDVPAAHMALPSVGFVRWLLIVPMVLAVLLLWLGYEGREMPFMEMNYQPTDSTGYRPLVHPKAVLDSVPRTINGEPAAGLTPPLPNLPGGEVPEVAKTLRNPLAGSTAAVREGRQLYAINCVMCHGKAGQGDGAAGESYTPRPTNLQSGGVRNLPDGAIFYSITNGILSTPIPEAARYLPRDWHAFRRETTDHERWAMVTFVRSLENGNASVR